jgi:hypothetical protein
VSGAQLRDRVRSLDQVQAEGAALQKSEGVTSTTATRAAQRTPQSETATLPGRHPLQAPPPPSDGIPAIAVAGDPIAMGMTRT